jgi:cytochrome c553
MSSPTPPEFTDEMVKLGAVTYESNCRWCHGSPLEQLPVVAASMTPHPPNLQRTVGRWDKRELFYIVKHGIKMTGMPAWPTQLRNDEVWHVVAFLEAYKDMNSTHYGRMTEAVGSNSPPASTVQALAQERCAPCHGAAGAAPISPDVPRLAGLSREYLHSTLAAFNSGTRISGIMQPPAARLTSAQLESLADYYAQDSANLVEGPSHGEEHKIARQTTITRQEFAAGEQLALHGHAIKKIPACVECHGPGQDLASPNYPRLAGQPAEYLEHQLLLMAEGRRGGTPRVDLMHVIADKLSEQERMQLALYYSHAIVSD